VDDSQDAGNVDQAVQRLPTAPQLPHRESIGGDPQQKEDGPRGHADGDERPLADILDHRHDIEVVDEDDPGQQVQRAVKKRKQPEHAAELDDLVRARDASERRNGQGDRDEGDRPGPGLVGEVVARVGGQGVEVAQEDRSIQTGGKRRGGDERRDEAQNFDDSDRL
jgi:hypothetical protein